jgi:hypothetical protein
MKPQEHTPLDKIPPLVAFDSEDDSNGNVKSFSFKWFNKRGEIEKYTTYDTEDARHWVRNRKRSIFIAHNLEYDIVNLYREVGFDEIEEMSYTAKLISAAIKGRKHRFIDSFSFFPSSLAQMGDSIGLEKLAFDPDSLEYAERDPEIVLEFMTKFRNQIIKDYDMDFTNTIGGLSMKIFLEKYLTREFIPFNEQICLDAFYGGRCEVFYKGKVPKKISESDINSEYPTVMTYEFPDTNTIRKMENTNARFGVARCTVKTPNDLHIPVLPYRTMGKLVFPLGEFTGTWTFHEIHEAEKRGYKVIKVHEAYGTDEGCFPFTKFMEEQYKKRLETDNELIKLFTKLLMNNLYGKLVTHKDRCVITHGAMRLDKQEKTEAELQTTYGEIHVYKVPTKIPPPSANYIWGAYVTSYGRIMLLENLEKAHNNKGTTLLYCDTDSVITTGKKPPLDYDQKRLGALKCEEWDMGHFYMPKGYILIRKEKKKITCKGIPQPPEIKEKGLELTLENPRMQFLELGRAEFRKPVKFRQSFPQKKKANVWEKQSKSRKITSTKRREARDGTTSPLVITEDVGV